MSEREKLSTEPYKGVRDFYPEDWGRLSGVFDTVRETLKRKGYQEYQASPLEPSELYESKGNEEIISEQTFTFEDRGGRRVTLRPEMTPTLARLVAGKRRELPFPLRWFSIGNRFRYERPQRGRLREFFQCDVDLIGVEAGEADVEIISLAHEVLTALGAKQEDFVIRVNHRGLFDIMASLNQIDGSPTEKKEVMRKLLRLVDAKEKMSSNQFEEKLSGLGFPESMFDDSFFDEKVMKQLGLDTLLERLASAGITNVRWDPTIARGFDYYDGIVFEIFDTNPENPRALFGGGRYDKLVTLFGGDPIPAVGFAIGDVTLLDFLETHGLLKESSSAPRVHLIPVEASDITEARKFQEQHLRDTTSTLGITGKSVGDQIKEADKRGTPYVIVFGKDEHASNEVTVKELASGKEEGMAKGEVSGRVR
jgi:histidyl-tRNA synthetase